MRFEARIKNVPDQQWGVWDHEAEEWRESMLGTTEEADARQSADVMNTMPDRYALGFRMRIKRPPRTFLARMVVTVVFGVAAMQLMVPDNWHPAGPAVGFMVTMVGLGWAWWKLFQVERYTPDVHIVHMGLDPFDEDEG